jgi:hypothetical protein
MVSSEIRAAFLAATLATASVALVQAAPPEQTFCRSTAPVSPVKTPATLVAAVASAFQIDNASARDGAFVRCVGQKLLACYVGANLNCSKADTRRMLPGATAWCRDNPGSATIPMSATGHDTIYEWSCKGHRAVAGRIVMTIDAQGYITENWKELR